MDGGRLILAHQAAIAFDIGTEDRRQPAFHGLSPDICRCSNQRMAVSSRKRSPWLCLALTPPSRRERGNRLTSFPSLGQRCAHTTRRVVYGLFASFAAWIGNGRGTRPTRGMPGSQENMAM